MISLLAHPSVILLLGAVIVAVLPRKYKRYILLAVGITSFILALRLPVGMEYSIPFIEGLPLMILKVDKLAWLMTSAATFMVLVSILYGWGEIGHREITWGLVYAGASCGALLSGSLMMLVIWWEVMAVGAAFMLISRHDHHAVNAGIRYLLVHFFGGNLLLFGVALLARQGYVLVEPLSRSMGAGYWLVLAGVGVSAGMMPFHSWIADAYPNASIAGSVLMNSMTTKVASITLLRLFAGERFLLGMGLVMAYWGVLYALRENHIRRLLSYSTISQVGLIVTAVGIGTPLAGNAAVALVVGNMLYKGMLFMSTGSIYYCTGKQKLTELGHQVETLPTNAFFFFIGALAIAGMPGLMGFACKPMVMAAAGEEHMALVSFLLYFASIGTFLSVTLKLGYNMFVGLNPAPVMEKQPKPTMYAAMAILAAVIIAAGAMPELLYRYLPWRAEAPYNPFTLDHVLSELQLLLGGLLAFVVLHHLFRIKKGISLDLDWFYRRPLASLVLMLSNGLNSFRLAVWRSLLGILEGILPFFRNPMRILMPWKTGGKEDFRPDRYRLPVGAGASWILMAFALMFFILSAAV